jgi:putative ABC transport system ATP-binding protein
MLLNATAISKAYRDGPRTVQALSDVAVHVDNGEFVAVKGPSGCGKSTLLLIAGGLLQPDSGRVLVDDTDPYTLALNQRAEFRAKNIGFVFQQFHLVPYLTVFDNVLAPAIALQKNAQESRDRAMQLIERFGLADRRDHVPGKLSSGERQRTAMARALLNEPKLLLADEPTGNLDQENAESLLGHLGEFANAGGGVLLVTHDDRAVPYADRTVKLAIGAVV